MMKQYIKPAIEVTETENIEIIALSVISEKADNSEVLSKEEGSWNIWEEE